MISINILNPIADIELPKKSNPRRITMLSLSLNRFFQRATFLAVTLAILFGSFAVTPAQAATCAEYYTVKSGDTLYRIGLKYNLLWTTIAKANNITDGNKIYAGQSLCIPKDGSTSTSGSTTQRSSKIPTFSIVEVTKDKSVTIKTANFPKDQEFVVRMGLYGTLGVKGEKVATVSSGKGGEMSFTFNFPASLAGEAQIAIRLESTSGYYAYNWFYNQSTK